MGRRRLELATTTTAITAAVGFIIVVVALFGIRAKAEYDKVFYYRCNTTKFDTVKDTELANDARIFINALSDGISYGYEPANRDRLIPYGQDGSFIHTWVHCRSSEICPVCLPAVALTTIQNCNNCYGVDFQNDDCEIRIRGKAEYDNGFVYRCNETKFEPVKDEVLAQGARVLHPRCPKLVITLNGVDILNDDCEIRYETYPF